MRVVQPMTTRRLARQLESQGCVVNAMHALWSEAKHFGFDQDTILDKRTTRIYESRDYKRLTVVQRAYMAGVWDTLSTANWHSLTRQTLIDNRWLTEAQLDALGTSHKDRHELARGHRYVWPATTSQYWPSVSECADGYECPERAYATHAADGSHCHLDRSPSLRS